jgi:hypothetical protein
MVARSFSVTMVYCLLFGVPLAPCAWDLRWHP